jgi:hypothetical protein
MLEEIFEKFFLDVLLELFIGVDLFIREFSQSPCCQHIHNLWKISQRKHLGKVIRLK